MFPSTIESSMNTMNTSFRKFGTYLYIMGLRSSPLGADLMSAYSLGKFNSLVELQLHAARSNLCQFPTTSRVDAQQQLRNYHRLVQSLLALVKAVGKSKNTQRLDVLNVSISPTHLF